MSMTIDGLEWDALGSVKRIARMEPSEISGLMLNRSYFNDVLGTWYDYDITIAVPRNRRTDYDEIYNVLTNPVSFHSFTLPYAQGSIEITGRVEQVEDTPVPMNNGIYWMGISFSVKSSYPSKYMSLDEVITIGMAPTPPEVEASIGDIYQYTATGWVQRFWEDVEDIYF